ncbi:histidine phosphatase family protein [Paenibacillus guangzhouensis]|uniref:histidine phosphatase family protein n=1 Tax=Paenibacillus guangzhouensis TaxID=1473112 RepID=UPI0012676F46|nr:histidine phosphatase family protein [Paenibacillus guangzhouensis]
MKQIYVVRHCQAEGQAADAPLTAVGQEQAQDLAAFLADRPIDYIVCSPYVRACDTIAPLAMQLGIEVQLDERLTERVLSEQNCPDWMDMLRATYDDLELCFEGGESSRMAMQRVVQVVQEMLERPGEHAVLVSHGNLISLLLKYFDDGFGFEQWRALSNPDVYLLSFSDYQQPSMTRLWLK